jgi:hypothetical protein
VSSMSSSSGSECDGIIDFGSRSPWPIPCAPSSQPRVAQHSSWAIVRWRFHARQRAHAVRTPCARCSVCIDRGGGPSPAPASNAPTSGRALGLAIDAYRGLAWRAKSPSADPCLATQLRAEGPGSNAEGVPTSFGTSTYSQCGRFVSTALKLQDEVPIATGEIKSS